MTDQVKQELIQIPASYVADHLNHTFYVLLGDRERKDLTDALVHFVRPLRMACVHITEDEIIRLLYETLSDCLRYDNRSYPDDDGLLRFTYAGGIFTGAAVCMGVAELCTLLGTALGLRVQTIIGYAGDPADSGGLHAWNLVWLKEGGREIPYHFDLTWDLAQYTKHRGFRYYLKSDAYMEEHQHQWLRERYPNCPRNRSSAMIPKIPVAAKRQLCKQFENMRRSLAQK